MQALRVMIGLIEHMQAAQQLMKRTDNRFDLALQLLE
jgi:hypothetical protein